MMRTFFALGLLTLRRIASRKTTYIILLVGVFVVWDLGVRFRVKSEDGDLTHIELDGRPAAQVHLQDSYLFDWFTLSFLGILVIAPVVPLMMQRGYVQSLHALPLSRTGMLLGHVIPATIAYLLLMGVPFVVVFFLQGMVSSYWNTSLLLLLIPLTAVAACVTSYLALFGVLSGSTSVSALLTWFYVFIIPIFLQYREKVLYRMTDSDIGKKLIDISYYLLPQLADMHTKGVSLVVQREWTFVPYGVSLATALPALLIAVAVFRRKSF